MAYKIRPGVVLIQVCNAEILVASRAIWKECPHIMPIPKQWAIGWRFMEIGKTDREFVSTLAEMTNNSSDTVRERFSKMFETLSAQGFLLEVPDEESEHDAQ